jgi:energy-coupling factor transporter transmembrane protein EcfT
MIMTESNEQKGSKQEPRKVVIKTQSKRGTSVLFPVILIAAGVILLLSALGRLPNLNWEAVLQLWPLLLIFIGLDIIIRLLPRTLATILSFLLALVAVGIFVGVLLFADEIPLIENLASESTQEVVDEQISYPAVGAAAADIFVDLGSRGTTVSSLANSKNLIEADVSYVGELIFETSTSDGLATVVLDTRESSDWLYWINPAHWFDSEEGRRWRIGLASDIPTNLDLDLGSGSAGLNLEDLTLSALTVDGSSGHVDLALPGGDYDMFYDSGSGSVNIGLPHSGLHRFLVESSSGSVSFLLPAGMEAMVVVEDKGSGSVNLDRSLFNQIKANDDGEGIWVTPGYEDSRNRIELVLDTGSGSVSIDSEN